MSIHVGTCINTTGAGSGIANFVKKHWVYIVAGIGVATAALCYFGTRGGAASTLCDLSGGIGGQSPDNFPDFFASRSQIEKKFSHAPVLGVTEPRGAAGFDTYAKALKSFTNDSSTIRILGTYHNKPAILSYNPDTRVVVVQKPSGAFWSSWRMSKGQLWNVEHRGSLGGG